MNTKRRLCTLILTLILAFTAQAAPVGEQTAKNLAARFLARQGATLKGDLSATPLPVAYAQRLHLFQSVESHCFVLMSADDCARPILAYSLDHAFGPDSLPPHVAGWLADYAAEVEYLIANHIDASPLTAALWRQLDASALQPKSGLQPVAPMLTTTWDQSPYYNALCPFDSNEWYRAVTGCVATATAQVMKFWNHPAVGSGSHIYPHPTFGTLAADFGSTAYDWTHMPDALTALSTDDEVNAVATLMFHVGVAVEMNYGHSSGAQTEANGSLTAVCSENALRTHFGYSPSIHSDHRSMHTDAEWVATLATELAAGRPVLYSGSDPSGGHAFVLDGLDSAGFFHVNWGWGGYCDGYYVIGALNPSSGGTGGNSTYTFNLRNAAILGIKPDSASSGSGSFSLSVSANDPSLGSGYIYELSFDNQGNWAPTDSGTFAYGDTVTVYASANVNGRFMQWSDGYMYNPRQMLVTENTQLTAIFEENSGDTLYYDNGHILSSYRFGNDFWWGIRFDVDDSLLVQKDSLYGILIFDSYLGDNHLHVFNGDWTNGTLLLDTIVSTSGTDHWRRFGFASPVAFDNTQSLCILFHHTGGGYPVPFSVWSGTAEGSRISYDASSWHYTSSGSFALRALFAPAPPRQFTITAAADQPDMGSVDGGGTFDEGSDIWLTAQAAPGFRFVGWTDNSHLNPRRVSVLESASYTALFEPVGDGYVYFDNAYTADTYCSDHEGVTWALRIDPAQLGSYDHLSNVYCRDVTSTAYTVSICQGGDTVPGTVIASEQGLFNASGWANHYFASPVPISPSQPLWIVFHVDGPSCALISGQYSGTPNSFLLTDGGWSSMTTASWLIRASFYGRYNCRTLPASVAPEASGSICGSLTVYNSNSTELLAKSAPGYRFLYWHLLSAQGNTLAYDNPLVVDSINAGDSLVAHFAPISGDTLGYDNPQSHVFNWGGIDATARWAIRLRPEHIGAHNHIDAVQLFDAAVADVDISVYQGGDTPEAGTLLASTSASQTESYSWISAPFSQPVAIDSTAPLWLVASTGNTGWVAPVAIYAGDDDSRWFNYNGEGWRYLRSFYSVKLRGLFSLQAVQPADTVQPVDTVQPIDTIQPIDTVQPADTTVAIRPTATSRAVVSAAHNTITVDGAEGRELRLYDLGGRLLAVRRRPVGRVLFDVPGPGVYLLQIGTDGLRRVVVM